MRLLDLCLTLMVIFIWGLNFVSLKINVEHMTPIFALAVRFMLVSILLMPWIVQLPPEKFWHIVALGMFMGVLYFGTLYIGMPYLPASETSIIVQIQTPIAVIASAIFLKEKVTWKVVAGILVAFLGVLITIGMPQRMGSIEGVVLILLAAVFWGLSAVMMRWLNDIDPLTQNGAYALVATPFLFALSFATEKHPFDCLWTAGWWGYGSLIYSTLLSSIVAYTLWMWVMRRNPVNKVVPFTLLLPAIGVASAHFILNDPIVPHMMIGAVIAVVGVAVIVFERGKAKA